jgi:hypothetical protein
MEITEDLTLIGEDDDEGEKLDFSQVVPGFAFSRRQDLFQEADEAWSKGPQVGTAHLGVIVGHRGVAICHVVFVLDGDDTIVAHGVLPLTDGPKGATVGNGLLAVTGGTGNFNGAGGRLDVEVMNPKRYHFTI